MFIDYISHLEDVKGTCKTFRDLIYEIYFDSGQLAETTTINCCGTAVYQRYFAPLKQCVELIRILRPSKLTQDRMNTITLSIAALDETGGVITIKRWNLRYNVVEASLVLAASDMQSTFSSFNPEERERINEAMHNNLEGCNYSCVAMSVSTVESRLYKLMTLAKPDSTSDLNKMTLGQLIKEYSENESSYQNIVPDKHDALLALCNTYRIFSVHPKDEYISGGIATSILNLSIAFLSDPDSTPESVNIKLSSK